MNDQVEYAETQWACRRSHTSSEANAPGPQSYTYWKAITDPDARPNEQSDTNATLMGSS